MSSGVYLYALAAVFQASGAAGAAMLAPFFMKARGYSIALVGIPIVINGLGRVASDLLSGFLASYFSAGLLLVLAAAVGLGASLVGAALWEVMSLFLGVWVVLGLTEAMFALALRKIAFDLSPSGEQGKVQGHVASALGIGFALGPALAGLIGERWGFEVLFLHYALHQTAGLVLVLLARAHRVGKPTVSKGAPIWREGRNLLLRLPFLAACFAIFQSFLFLVGMIRVAFPFLAVARGISLEIIGMMVGLSRLADTGGRFTGGWLSDRIGTSPVIQGGILLGVPMFILVVLGSGFWTLMIPFAIMTMGFGFTNVGSTTFALQSADAAVKGLGLGIVRAATSMGIMLGPLLAGVLIQRLGYQWGFWSMAIISVAVFLIVWSGFRSAVGKSG